MAMVRIIVYLFLAWLAWKVIVALQKVVVAYMKNAREVDPVKRQPKLRVLSYEEDPLHVLGLEEGASDEAIEAAFQRLREQYSPEKVEAMGPEVRQTAERMTRRIESAYAQLMGRDD